MRILILDGNENQAVASVRSLGRGGHEVWVGADTTWSKAGWSRYAAGSVRYPSPRDDARGFIDFLAKGLNGETDYLVLPMTESTTFLVSLNRERLHKAGIRTLLPAHEHLLTAFNKNETRRIAEKLGIATPRTVAAIDSASALAAARELGFPVVVKAESSEKFDAIGNTAATGAPCYAASPATLEKAFIGFHEVCPTVLIQEYVPGAGKGYFALLREGELRAEFAHKRIRDVRPTGSGSSLRESIAVSPAMREAGLAILRELRWHGVAMVEFRERPDGRLVFLEVNGRFWNSLALAIHAGVDFPRLLVELAEQGDVNQPPPYRIGVRCRWILGDVRHLIAVMAGAPPDYPGMYPGRLPTLVRFAIPTPGMKHDNWTLTDPGPAIGDWFNFLGRQVPKALRSRHVKLR